MSRPVCRGTIDVLGSPHEGVAEAGDLAVNADVLAALGGATVGISACRVLAPLAVATIVDDFHVGRGEFGRKVLMDRGTVPGHDEQVSGHPLAMYRDPWPRTEFCVWAPRRRRGSALLLLDSLVRPRHHRRRDRGKGDSRARDVVPY